MNPEITERPESLALAPHPAPWRQRSGSVWREDRWPTPAYHQLGSPLRPGQQGYSTSSEEVKSSPGELRSWRGTKGRKMGDSKSASCSDLAQQRAQGTNPPPHMSRRPAEAPRGGGVLLGFRGWDPPHCHKAR